MAPKRKRTGSALLGAELRRRRGARTLQDISALSKSPPFSERVEPIGVSTLYMIEEGQTMPTLRSLQTMATIYRLPLQHLATLLSLERYQRSVPDAVRPEGLREETLEALARADYEMAYAAALAWEEAAGSPTGRRAAINNKASALWKLGHVDEACLLLLDLVADPDLRPRQALVAFTNLAEVFRSKGNLRQALVQAEAGLTIALAEGDVKAQAYLVRTRANIRTDEIARDLGLPPNRRAPTQEQRQSLLQTLDDYERSSTLHGQLGQETEALFNEISVGLTWSLLGDHARATRHLQGAARAFATREHVYGEAAALLELGRAAIEHGDDADARELLWRAERLAMSDSHPDVAFAAYFHLMGLESRQAGNPTFFLRKCQRLHPILETRGAEVAAFESLVGRAVVGR